MTAAAHRQPTGELTSNLGSHRAPTSVWDKRGWNGPTIEERVGPWLASLAGAGLVLYGAKRRDWRGACWIAGGIGLIAGAVAGLSNPSQARMTWRHYLDRIDGFLSRQRRAIVEHDGLRRLSQSSSLRTFSSRGTGPDG